MQVSKRIFNLETETAFPINSNIYTISNMRKIFKCEVGLSDHIMGFGASIASISLGASIIEKHQVLKRSKGGVDSAFSIDPHEMKILVDETENVWQSLGRVSYGPTDAEKPSLKFRRSLYVVKDIEVNQKFTKENLRIIRPGNGLAPKYYNQVLGRKVNKKLKKGTAVKWDYLQ